ncbi:PH domain-containing protein [Burkholderia multivorans]|uniref:PH domain-containing protein n=1 Tax=Burkholderia multivorans TaxID=87883 RepID=UPI00338EC2A6
MLNRVSASVEFARIQNVLAHQAWWQRIFGTGTVLIQTTDRTIKTGRLPASGIPTKCASASCAQRLLLATITARPKR